MARLKSGATAEFMGRTSLGGWPGTRTRTGSSPAVTRNRYGEGTLGGRGSESRQPTTCDGSEPLHLMTIHYLCSGMIRGTLPLFQTAEDS
jgi:hypothetical protein